MELLTIAAVLLMCLFSQIEGALSDNSQNRSDDFDSGSGDLNEREQDEPRPFCCVSGNITFHSIADILNNISSNNTIVNITTDVVLFSNVTLEGLENIMIIGHRNPVVKCNDVGAVKFISCKNITIEGIQWEGCGSKDYPGIEFYNSSSNVSFERCSFNNSGALLSEVSGNVYIKNCNFTHKYEYSGHGAAIHYSPNTNSHGQLKLVVQNSQFIFNRATQSVVYIDGSGSRIPGHVYLQDNVFVNNKGVPIYISHTNLHIRGSLLLKDNTAKSGGGIYSNNSTIVFYDKCDVNFISNSVNDSGGAIYQTYSTIIFEENSMVTFKDHSAIYGGALDSNNSDITFDGTSIKFSNNTASIGGAVYCQCSSHITFDGNSSVTFNNNEAGGGGAVYCVSSSHITFDGNSSVTFSNNTASVSGGAVYSMSSCHITFDGNSSVTFNNNEASGGGAVCCVSSSHITFDGNSSVTFNNNTASVSGGAVYCVSSCHITFDGNSSVKFNNNEAKTGGAIVCLSSSPITLDGTSSVTFNNNKASDYGGAVYCNAQCNVSLCATTVVTFINNSATIGGAIFSQYSYILAKETSAIQFIHNSATYGGATYLRDQATILLEGSCMIAFKDNKATEGGGALLITTYCTAIFTGYSEVTYSNNEVTQYGGAIYCSDNSNITLDENVTVKFTNNTSEYGGALSVIQSNLTFNGNSLANFTNNIAEQGGAFYVLLSSVTLQGNITANFTGNRAENGGAISIVESSVTFADNSQTELFRNSATESGGAMHLSDHFTVNICNNSHITFYHNTANRYGGAMYCDLTKSANNKLTFKITDIVFYSNADLLGSDVYVDIPTSCDETCVNNSIINKGYGQFGGVIKTSPRKLEFNDSAVTCVDNDNDTNCQTYLTKNIMLGQEIIINACALDYFNQLAGPTQFELSGEDQDHHLIGSDNVLISCTVFEGVSINGERVFEATNYSINITSYYGSISDGKEFTIELITELSPCHPGFYHDNTTCVCYSDSDIVSCSGSTSSIKRGYWFGEVNDKTTVAICPNSYCNFTCCETANGFFKLSPVRANQCNFQRSGTGCGSCKEGYTLSFDSIECVSVDMCTTEQTVLVVTLSILYWVVIVILVFIVTYYHIGIGYLYAITYYYSMVEILLSERLYSSQGLFSFVSIMSSIAKVTPQFLGQLCLVTNMSGIDQQFIHYVHPLAVAIIMIVICQSARISYKFSSFVSRGIIHVISFLLLLSYTSVATTSLLLLRSLTFDNVDKVYTYLSPDIEYFHGRHLPYVIIAIAYSLIIVIGLPLLLLLEPFLNHKINFTRMKPLLDQFQGCYKDKYRSFAAYYMTCRLVIILIIIANPSNINTTQYSLVISNSTLALIHVTLRPYGSNILNVFDGFVLQLMIVVSMVPLIDSYDPDLLLSFMFVLVILPLIPFLIMEIYLYKKTIKKITKYCVPPKPDTTNSNNEVPMRDFVDSVIDDSKRVNATICEM